MTQPTPLLLAVDGNSLVHRAHHAQSGTNLRHSDGRPLWAVRGVLTLIGGIAARFHPAAVVVGFDDPTSSVRAGRYPAYKAGRPEHAPEIAEQVVILAETLSALGVPVRVADGYEADDVLASAAAQAADAGWRCLLATSDRDSWALVTDSTRVLRVGGPIAEAPVLGPAEVAGLTGVSPAQYRDLAALRGDSSDNLPGVRGIGGVTAAKLLTALGSLDDAFADLADGGEKVTAAIGKAGAAKLADPAAREAVDRNRDLMRLRADVPLHLALDATTGPGRLPLPDPAATLAAVELAALTGRWRHVFGGEPAATGAAVAPAVDTDSRPPAADRPAVPAPRPAPAVERTSEPARTPVLGGRVPARPGNWPLTL